MWCGLDRPLLPTGTSTCFAKFLTQTHPLGWNLRQKWSALDTESTVRSKTGVD